MITVERSERNLNDYPFMEIPESWFPTLYEFFDEYESLMDRYNLPYDTVEFLQIKEKFDKLRIYYGVSKLLDENLSGLDCIVYKAIDGLIAVIVEKYEKIIEYKVKEGLL